ncbi:MAG TPA: cupin domain-containing protein [Pseudomonadales bacterium]|nr:cupin domain-containing protein [Pseudomonadales bacterium]
MTSTTFFQAGSLNDWKQWSFKHPLLPRPAPGKLFLGDKLELTGMEVSLNTLPAGQGMPFYHRHRQHEEVYIILSGEGEFQVDGERLAVQEGSTLRMSPEVVRAWRNTGSEPLVYLVIQAVEDSLKQHGINDGEAVPGAVVW